MLEAHLETDMGDAAFVLSHGKNAGGLHTPAFTVLQNTDPGVTSELEISWLNRIVLVPAIRSFCLASE